MTAFTKESLSYHGGYLHYHPHADTYWEGRKFVKTLIKHYSVEDYFAKLEAGRAPLQILQDDGHLIFDGRFFYLDGKVC